MRHKLCSSFQPWCPGVKTRCLVSFYFYILRAEFSWCPYVYLCYVFICSWLVLLNCYCVLWYFVRNDEIKLYNQQSIIHALVDWEHMASRLERVPTEKMRFIAWVHSATKDTFTSNGSWRQGIKGEMTCTVYWPAHRAGLLRWNFFGQPGSVSKFPPFLWVNLWVGWVGRGYIEISRYFPALWINWVTLVTKIKLWYSLGY